MTNPVNNSSSLILEALTKNENTSVLLCALLQKVLEARAGDDKAAEKKKAAAVLTAPAVDPSGDAPLTPAQQGMVLLGDLSYLDFLANQLLNVNAPAWVQSAYNALVTQINSMIQSAPAGSIDPTILALANKVMANTNPPSFYLQTFETAINNLPEVDPTTQYTSIADWMNANAASFSAGDNLQVAGAIAMFMTDMEYDINNEGNDPWTPKWNDAMTALIGPNGFWNSQDNNEPIPESASQATADLLLYFFWSQSGGNATQFQTLVQNFESIANPSNWAAPKSVDAGYSSFYTTFNAELANWNNGPPIDPQEYLENFFGVFG